MATTDSSREGSVTHRVYRLQWIVAGRFIYLTGVLTTIDRSKESSLNSEGAPATTNRTVARRAQLAPQRVLVTTDSSMEGSASSQGALVTTDSSRRAHIGHRGIGYKDSCR